MTSWNISQSIIRKKNKKKNNFWILHVQTILGYVSTPVETFAKEIERDVTAVKGGSRWYWIKSKSHILFDFYMMQFFLFVYQIR